MIEAGNEPMLSNLPSDTAQALRRYSYVGGNKF